MILRFGDFELDEERNELRRDGQPVEILPTQLRLLRYLLDRRDRAVPKNEILDGVWPDAVVSETAFTTALSHLRRTLGDDGTAQRIIRTQRGHGIRFVASVKEGPASPDASDRPASAEREGSALERRLAAVLSADAVGYSRLMAQDEAGTVLQLRRAREVMTRCIRADGGRVVDAVGDNLLAEFPSAVAAVRSGAAIQDQLGTSPDGGRLRFRIGIHLGEVGVDGPRIFGDAVNIAARLEALAAPGGLCVSETVVDQLRGKLELTFEDGGEHALKNIPRPVRAYRHSGSTPTEAKPSVPDAQKPTVAVPPLRAGDDSPEKRELTATLAEDLANLLARNPGLAVIGPAAVGSPSAPTRYTVAGSVSGLGARLRITIALVDSASGVQLWTDRREVERGRLEQAYDDLTFGLASALASELSTLEGERTRGDEEASLSAAELVPRALLERAEGFSGASLRRAERLLRLALERDPDHGLALAALGAMISSRVLWALSEAPTAEASEARELEQRAARVAPHDPRVLGWRATILMNLGEVETAIRWLERCLELDPTLVNFEARLGWAWIIAGRIEEGLDRIDTALARSPRDLQSYNSLFYQGVGLGMLGRLDEAEEALRRSIDRFGGRYQSWLVLALVLDVAGRRTEAVEAIAAARAAEPSLDWEGALGLIARAGPGAARLPDLADRLASLWREQEAGRSAPGP